jgi:CheY-like chemotaxis protein
MDHMMPGLDGVEATGILRGLGYVHPIVALTANAMSGQSEMFLSQGFDKFISKPIDSRELDMVLKELVRDRQPPETLETARREKRKPGPAPKTDSTELEKYFILDAKEGVKVLKDLQAKSDSLSEADFALYATTVHGLKSALANIGEAKLSEFALDLEKAGRTRNLDAMIDKTPAFIKKLESLIARLKPKETGEACKASRDDLFDLKEKLQEFRAACQSFNKKSAESVLADLTQKTWPPEIDDALNEISVGLLRGEYKKVLSLAERLTAALGD